MNNLKSLLMLPLLLLSITACSQGPSDDFVTAAPALKEYSKEEQCKALNELFRSRERGDVMLPQMMQDYKLLRDQTRLARGEVIPPPDQSICQPDTTSLDNIVNEPPIVDPPPLP
jgi:hypothetical protein